MRAGLGPGIGLGWRLARGRGRLHLLQTGFVALAGLWFVSVVLGAVSIDQARGRQLARDHARVPRLAGLEVPSERPDEAGTPDPGRFDGRGGTLYLSRADIVAGRQFPVVLIAPNAAVDGSAAPLPPGLVGFPAPGEAALSPELTRLLDADPDLRGRYRGTTLIGAEGLRSPDELLAYVGVEPAVLREMRWTGLAVGFGARHGTGEFLFSPPSRLLYWTGVSLFALVPALVALMVAARVNSRLRDNQLGALRIVGAPNSTIRSIAAVEFAVPFGVGAVVAAVTHRLLVAWWAERGMFGYRAFPADLWLSPALTGALVPGTVMAATAFVVVAAERGSRLGPALRPSLVPDRLSVATLVPPAIGLGAAIWAAWSDGDRSDDVLAGALVLVAVSLPPALPLLMRTLGRALASAGGGAVGLVTGRHLAYSPRRFARLSMGTAVLAFVAVNAATVWSVGQGTLAGEATDPTGDRAAVVVVRGVDPTGIPADDIDVLAVHEAVGGEGEAVELVVGSCGALESLGAPAGVCRHDRAVVVTVPGTGPVDPRAAGELILEGGVTLTVADGDLPLARGTPRVLSGAVFVPTGLATALGITRTTPEAWLLVPTPSGPRAARVASDVLARYPQALVRVPGEEATAGLMASLRASSWFRAGLVVAVPTTLLGLAMGVIGSLEEQGTERRSLRHVGSRRLQRRAIALLEAALPAVSAVSVSVVGGLITSWCLVGLAGTGRIPWTVAGGVVAVTGVMAVALGVASGQVGDGDRVPEGRESWRRRHGVAATG